MTESIRSTLTLEQIPGRRDELAAAAQDILTRNADAGDLAGDELAAFERITAELEALKTRETALRRLTAAVAAGNVERAQGPQYAPLTRQTTPADEARRVIDAAHTRGELPDRAAELVTRLVTTSDTPAAARWATVTGSEHYRSAFAKLVRDPSRGHLEWTGPEGDAFRAVQDLQRAMNIGTNTAGGYLVPFQLDPTVLLTSDGSNNPLRKIARVETVVSSAWHGITSAGATGEWKTEGSAAADASPTIAQPTVGVHLGDAYVPFSFELEQDGSDFIRQLQMVLTDAADQLQATAFTTGSGSGQPEGVITGLASGQKVSSDTAGVIAAGDVTAVQNDLPARFQGRAQWCAPLSTINTVASIETTNGALRFPEVGSGNLLRKPLNELSNMVSVGDADPALTLLYGDFSQFLIVDRIGTSLELIQNVMDTSTGRPTGQRGALLWFRTGSKVLVPQAFRVLSVAEAGS